MITASSLKKRVIDCLQTTAARVLLAVFFSTAGMLHFIFPAQYASVMPPWLPAHAALVAISGWCELAGGIGLLMAPTRRAAGWGLLLLCVAVLPANVQMWLAAIAADKSVWLEGVLLLRLPLQVPLMLWIWYVMSR
jgi:uncharacterized membrane protein